MGRPCLAESAWFSSSVTPPRFYRLPAPKVSAPNPLPCPAPGHPIAPGPPPRSLSACPSAHVPPQAGRVQPIRADPATRRVAFTAEGPPARSGTRTKHGDWTTTTTMTMVADPGRAGFRAGPAGCSDGVEGPSSSSYKR